MLLIGVLLLFIVGAVVRTWLFRREGVLSEPLAKGSIVQSVYGIGTVAARKAFQAKGGITSHLDEIYVREGDDVHRGDRLVLLDQLTVRAPFDGTITYLPYTTQELVFTQSIILKLVDLRDRYMTVSLEQQGALQVRPGQPVKINFETIRDSTYDGTVQSVYSNGGDLLARIDVKDLPNHILPGMTADVAIIIKKKNDVLLIPVAAIQGDHVKVKRGVGAPVDVKIKTGLIDQDKAEVISGDIAPGDRLVIGDSKGP